MTAQPTLQNRHTPWWLPAALIASLMLSTALFALLVLQKAGTGNTNSQVHNVGEGGSGQDVYNWRMVTTWPKRFPGLGQAPENLAEQLRRMSNGRLNITVYGANEIVPAMGVFDAVSSGSIEMGHSAAYYWKGKLAASSFFASVPFGMNAQEFNGWLHYGGGLELWREVYAPFNLVPFAGGNTGVQMGGWFNREIRSLADIRGLKMRIPGFGGEVFARAGGTAVNIPGGELYSALQTGVIDAAEWVSPYNDRAFGFHQIARYYYYPGWQEPGPGLEFIINKRAWDRLPDDLKAMVEAATRTINQDLLDEYTARNNTALKALIDDHKVQLRAFPDDVLAAFKRISWEIYDETAAKDPVFAKVWQSYRSFLEDVQEYHAIGEHIYYEKR